MDGSRRRKKIMELLTEEGKPISGGDLAQRLGVSRQVVVQDIALLRAENKTIMSTNKGYLLQQEKEEMKHSCIRVFQTSHKTEDTLDELNTIVDYGGRIRNVLIEHQLYGQIEVDLIINNRLDAAEFMQRMKYSKDQPLNVLTGGCHYHTVEADSEKNLDFIEEELKNKGYLI
ncbi:transcription repressor NadR [Clostridium boliviensis]|uniref:Transcription repressor NadR n=1 Tax=Clostridium boliviensis TaxID=318465 RepID=A0ABU4GID1_9CLOT|nr:transcription repressor NadR [Clostridium boliviensis]MDW2796017.1 transcription repressor NadR [Clostridium boliviensis]